MRTLLYTAAGVTVAMVALSATVPADATGGHHSRAAAQRQAPSPFKVVATGLHNPRQIAFGPHGTMYVAEAGQGGDGPCITGGEGPSCYGATGSVMRVHAGKQYRVLRGLASLGNQGNGESAIGPADLARVGKHRLVLSFGLGGAPRERKKVPMRGQRQLGHLLSFDLRTKRFTDRGDLARHEAKTNPVNERNSDPTGIAKAGKAGWMVTDSGGNTLVSAMARQVKTRAAFQNRMHAGQPYESVPTDVAKGPDGAFYVSELTGFPFSPGVARIWRVVPGHKAHVWANHLTNVTSIAWDGKKLYAVQLADNGLLGGPPGSLVRVFSKSSGKPARTVAPGLFFPYGVAIHHGHAYVSQGAMFPTDGNVVKIPLR